MIAALLSAIAAALNRGDRQALRFGHPPPLVRAGHGPETVKPYLISTKRASAGAGAPRFCRHDGTLCRLLPAQPSIVPTGNPSWEPVFGIRVRAGAGETSGTPPSCPPASYRGHCADVVAPGAGVQNHWPGFWCPPDHSMAGSAGWPGRDRWDTARAVRAVRCGCSGRPQGGAFRLVMPWAAAGHGRERGPDARRRPGSPGGPITLATPADDDGR
jgi:hypothetical protein